MEVLGNNSHLKESETQVPVSNYSCRLPRDLNLGVNSGLRNHGETDIGLLVACKVQLSSEVIRWKTETLRLQKGCDSAVQRSKDLDQMVAKLGDRSRELEERLIQLEDENKHLKSRSIDEGKVALMQKLSHGFDKYHSFPWSETTTKPPVVPRLSRLQTSEFRKSQVLPNEDWREVSQKMLQQMKEEMRELQEMSNRFSAEGKENAADTSSEIDTDCKEQLEEGLSSLLSDMESLKHHLLEQQQKLKSLAIGFNSGKIQLKGNPNFKSGIKNSDSNVNMQYPVMKHKSSSPSLNRPSDEKYRVYFTKQLETLEDLNKITKEMRHFPESQEIGSPRKSSSDIRRNSKCANSVLPPQRNSAEARSSAEGRDDKVCPICKENFGTTVSEKTFEKHVVNHLESESASFLDQYVVL